jgi:hypothetical protein
VGFKSGFCYYIFCWLCVVCLVMFGALIMIFIYIYCFNDVKLPLIYFHILFRRYFKPVWGYDRLIILVVRRSPFWVCSCVVIVWCFWRKMPRKLWIFENHSKQLRLSNVWRGLCILC